MPKTTLANILATLLVLSSFFVNSTLMADQRNTPERAASIMTQVTRSNDYGDLPKSIAQKQIFMPAQVPTIAEALSLVKKASQGAAAQLIKNTKVPTNIITVPEDFKSIQAAIDSSKPGDTIRVKPGIYYEQLYIKAGIRLVSFDHHINQLSDIDGATLQLPERTLTTIIDGSKSSPSKFGLLDFEPGCQQDTVVDGFTIQNLPAQNHHIPGHAHAVNLRGSSPLLQNCLIQNNGSTGIGSHVIYHDQDKKIVERDFRQVNIKFQASALIYNNIVRSNLGRGIGCNHFSSPVIIGNEVMDNDDTILGEAPGPGIGIKHGASPRLIGNIVHDNNGGGILIKYGEPQGVEPIDQRPQVSVESNLIYDNGSNRPALSCRQSGTTEKPINFTGNYIYNFGNVGIGIGYDSIGVIVGNTVSNGNFAGIAVRNSTALRISDNNISNIHNSAFAIINQSNVKFLSGNRISKINSSPFLIQHSTIEGIKL